MTAGLSGSWVFEPRIQGSIRGTLLLEQNERKLTATLRIDNHVLKGEGQTDGNRFDLMLTHADGSGPAHSERLRLAGQLDGDRIIGIFESETDGGYWLGTRGAGQ